MKLEKVVYMEEWMDVRKTLPEMANSKLVNVGREKSNFEKKTFPSQQLKQKLLIPFQVLDWF